MEIKELGPPLADGPQSVSSRDDKILFLPDVTNAALTAHVPAEAEGKVKELSLKEFAEIERLVGHPLPDPDSQTVPSMRAELAPTDGAEILDRSAHVPVR